MKRTQYLFLTLAIALLCFIPISAQTTSEQQVPTQYYGSFESAGTTWKVLVIPPKTSNEKFIALAKELHQKEPTTKFYFFDDDSEVRQFVAAKNGRGAYPEKWVSKHHVGNLQTMAFDSSGPEWVSINQYQTKLVSLEPEPIAPKQIRPTAASRKEALPGQVMIEFDTFKNLTTVSIKISQLSVTRGNELYLSALFAYSGQTPPRRDPFVLQFLSLAPEWKFTNGAELNLLVDGERMSLGYLKRDLAEVARWISA